jgi:hypothetical protein
LPNHKLECAAPAGFYPLSVCLSVSLFQEPELTALRAIGYVPQEYEREEKIEMLRPSRILVIPLSLFRAVIIGAARPATGQEQPLEISDVQFHSEG